MESPHLGKLVAESCCDWLITSLRSFSATSILLSRGPNEVRFASLVGEKILFRFPPISSVSVVVLIALVILPTPRVVSSTDCRR